MIASKTKESREFFIFLFQVFLVLLLISVFLLSIYRKFDQDEIEAVHTSWKILNGEQIFVDFFQHHHPFFYYCIAPIISLVGEDLNVLYALRIIMYGFMLGMLVFSYKLTNLVFDSKFMNWLTVLLMATMTMFTRKAIEIRPDVPQIFFAIMALYFLFMFKKNQKNRFQYLSAFLLAISFLFLQKTLFISIGIFLIQVFWFYKMNYKVKDIILYWSLFLVTISPYYMWLFGVGQFEQYFLLNWLLNLHFEFSFSPFKTIIDSLYYNHFNWLFYLYGLVICIRKRIIEIPLLSVILLSTVFLVKAPFRQYFMPFIPFMCMILAYGIYSTMNYKQAITVVACIFIVPVVYNMLTVLNYPNKSQMEKFDWILSQTPKDGYVYDGRAEINLFRSDVDYFWFSVEPGKGGLQTYQKLKPYQYNIYNSIEKHKPSIISDAFIDDLSHPTILENYKTSDEYKDLLIRKE